jgi:uncharacterized small protein (DUF1192 family)
MLTLLKRNPEQSPNQGHAWHSNFRNAAELPDTKVVRTAFFVNSIALLALSALILLFGHQEYNIATIRAEIASTEAQIAKDKAASEQAVALHKKFEEEDRKFTELESFLKGNKVVLSDFIVSVGRLLPKRMAITTLEYADAAVVIRGYVAGSTEAVSTYEKSLKDNAEFRQRFESISITNLSRDAEGSRFAFELTMKFSGIKKDPKKP